PGERVALVGYSGSGKTTLVKLLYRLYDVDKGKIFIDGKNIKEFKQESLRGELSIVPQECILFDDTIYNNILFSKPSATREEVFKAIKFSQLDKFIRGLPKKEKTIVGERGVKLSGGEKQRVSIARAILADKKILLLDEATSSLDSKTEWEIQSALKKLMQGRTSIIIAHRLSTIMHADKIVVMEKGKVVQLGKHRDLIDEHGVYKELWNLQKGGYIEE
ncbi:MAG: ATP-binding cassette domain-containing protein, partial [Nanoarchaeota archaeon]|nr:ATP-binding cassette domain-containing protein [Nanoarchaeota archaeon]